MSERDDLTRLRVVQAARVPVTPEMVAAQLDADEAAHTLTVFEVVKVLDELCAAGLVERLPADRYVQVRVFRDEVQRRLVANLAIPRNAAALQHELRADPTVGELPLSYIEDAVADAEDRGLVVCLGLFAEGVPADDLTPAERARANAAALAERARSDEDTVALTATQEKVLRERLSAPARAWRLAGDQWMLTTFGHDALQAIG